MSQPLIGAAPAVHRLTTRWWWSRIVAVVLAAVAVVVVLDLAPGQTAAGQAFPQSPAIEQTLGVRFSRVAVVGDGGLVTVSYVVLDPEKALGFQTTPQDAPVLVSETGDGSTHRVSLMRQGHTLRAGQTYYLVYENTAGALEPGGLMTLQLGDLELRHVPVL